METLFEELKRYVRFDVDDEAALRGLYPVVGPHFTAIADTFYRSDGNEIRHGFSL